jgi:hypothetical protein
MQARHAMLTGRSSEAVSSVAGPFLDRADLRGRGDTSAVRGAFDQSTVVRCGS